LERRRVREQAPRQVLPAHRRGPATARAGNPNLDARGRRHAPRAGGDLTMRALAILRSLWLTLVRRERLEQSLDEELRAYVDLLAAEYEAAGMDPAQARRRALIETGGIEQVKEATREAWIGHGVAPRAREFRVTLRGLRRARLFCSGGGGGPGIGSGAAAASSPGTGGSLPRRRPAVTDPATLVSLEPTRGG